MKSRRQTIFKEQGIKCNEKVARLEERVDEAYSMLRGEVACNRDPKVFSDAVKAAIRESELEAVLQANSEDLLSRVDGRFRKLELATNSCKKIFSAKP